MKKIIIGDNCIGCGACFSEYPEVITVNDEGLAVTTDNNEVDDSLAEEICSICPIATITAE